MFTVESQGSLLSIFKLSKSISINILFDFGCDSLVFYYSSGIISNSHYFCS